MASAEDLNRINFQISFFIIVSSSSEYAEYLGGDATFSGLVLGIPPLIACIVLPPMMKYDGGALIILITLPRVTGPPGGYKLPLHITCASAILGHVLYALAYRATFLYLILLGRMTTGLGFTMFMYHKRYCSDARFVGIRRRTTLASWLVVGQGVGMSVGPFLGGLLYKVGFRNSIWNGYTRPVLRCYAACIFATNHPLRLQPRMGHGCRMGCFLGVRYALV